MNAPLPQTPANVAEVQALVDALHDPSAKKAAIVEAALAGRLWHDEAELMIAANGLENA
jgi:hypothetical protein